MEIAPILLQQKSFRCTGRLHHRHSLRSHVGPSDLLAMTCVGRWCTGTLNYNMKNTGRDLVGSGKMWYNIYKENIYRKVR